MISPFHKFVVSWQHPRVMLALQVGSAQKKWKKWKKMDKIKAGWKRAESGTPIAFISLPRAKQHRRAADLLVFTEQSTLLLR